jgi:prepilin-type N-terminal cleavage/methylation domain-containing protein/prepilin-type processing-associated H-X9-DG protein
MSKRRAFTLVELLVVIGLIALLVGILLPAVNMVRQHATRVKCQSNMRQLGTAVVQYENSSSGYLPYPNWENTVDSPAIVNVPAADPQAFYGYGWLFAQPEFRTGYPANSDLNGLWGGLPHPPSDGMETGSIWPYVGTHDVYHCPSDNPDFYVGTEFMTSYLMNGAVCGFGKTGNSQFQTDTILATGYNIPSCKVSQMSFPSECVLFWEAMEQKYKGQSLTGAVWNDGSSYPSEEVLADRHTHGANVSFLDNHVEWWSPEKWAAYVNSTTNSQLWWSPFSVDGH